jgi:putative membrane protein
MGHAYWNDWYSGWGWFLWLGLIFLLFSGIGNWGYTYRAHRRFGSVLGGGAFEILDARYAKGEITRDEYARMKSDIGQTEPVGRPG